MCSNGNWISCTAPPVNDEICDGLDNDCECNFEPSPLYIPTFVESLVLVTTGAVLLNRYSSYENAGWAWFLLVAGLVELCWSVYDVCYATSKSMWEPEKWLYYIIGWFTFIVPWLAVYYSFYDAIGASDPGPPSWVKVVVWSLVFLFAGFAAVMFYYLRNYKDPEVMYKSEFAYLILSFVSKAALAWQLYNGLSMREGDLAPPDPTNQDCDLLGRLYNASCAS